MYLDLHHPLEDTPLDSATHKQRQEVALSLGYKCMAVITRSVAGPISSSDRCSSASSDLKQLSRLNIVASDAIQPGSTFTSVSKSYDLIAIVPKTERAMQQACSSLDCDIICLELNQRLPFKLKPSLLASAVKRGIHFEIIYSGLLRDPTSRRHLINNSQALTRILRGRNLILSSGARNSFEMRGPADVMALATQLLGFASKEKAQLALTQGPKNAVDHGGKRRS